MRVIGITGGVGAGKSEILQFLGEEWKDLSSRVVEADEVGYLVMRPNTTCFTEIVELFGPGILKKDGTLNRPAIAEQVFANDALRKKMNDIVHPAVKNYIKKAIEQEKKESTDFFFVEAALLIEDKYDEICDELWYIYADEATRTQRLMQNRGYSAEKIRNIFASQLDEDTFREHCDFVIDNSGNLEDTKEQIRQRMRIYETM